MFLYTRTHTHIYIYIHICIEISIHIHSGEIFETSDDGAVAFREYYKRAENADSALISTLLVDTDFDFVAPSNFTHDYSNSNVGCSSKSLSDAHTHTHTHTQAHAHTHTHTYAHTKALQREGPQVEIRKSLRAASFAT